MRAIDLVPAIIFDQVFIQEIKRVSVVVQDNPKPIKILNPAREGPRVLNVDRNPYWNLRVSLHPSASGKQSGVPIPGPSDNELLAEAMAKTGRAAVQGAIIASLDGPVPVMDVLGIAWASYKTIEAWEEYRVATQ